jgi:carboxyl-terminal processing protease
MKRFTRFLVIAASLAIAVTGIATTHLTVPSYADTESTSPDVVRLTTEVLERSQFGHHRLDDELAARFLDRYLDALDASRTLFFESDQDEFALLRHSLAEGTRLDGDLTPARSIFKRYLQRLDQRAAFVTTALQTQTFDFGGHDRYQYDRTEAPRPHDLAAAQSLWLQQLRAEYLVEKLNGKAPAEIAKTLTARQTRMVQTMKNFDDGEVSEIYLNALAHVYDPHSDYFGPEEAKNFSIAMNLSLVGIGATLEASDSGCKIRELVPGGPAERSGRLQPGDCIVAVAQDGKEPVDIANMPLSRAVELIRGAKGTTVELTIVPSNPSLEAARKTVRIVRAEVKLEQQQARAQIVDLPDANGRTTRLGIIDLPSFYEGADREHRSATADVARLLKKLKTEGVRGIVLDLRRNGGGSLEEAINLTGLFIHRGPVVQTRGPAGDVEISADNDSSELYSGPLLVLTSRFSASASEILAGALQDYGRALIVGDSSTFGKGTVQTILPLAPILKRNGIASAENAGELKVTIRKFYRPSGASTQLRGVKADIVIPSTSDLNEIGETAMKDPLPWDTIPSARFVKEDRVQPVVDALRAKSAQRVATENGFTWIHSEIAFRDQSRATKSVSLNELERREEKEQLKARQKVRQRELAELDGQLPHTYEITLKNAETPGLPPPLTRKPPQADAAESADDDASFGSDRDVIMNEAQCILSDYVGMESAPAGEVVSAGKVVSASSQLPEEIRKLGR